MIRTEFAAHVDIDPARAHGPDGDAAESSPPPPATTLTEQTRTDNARFFDGIAEVPCHVITQGLGTISAARHLVLIATG